MKSDSRINLKTILVACLGIALLTGCYEREEGCLDSNAENFDVYADDDCCCTYPDLRINTIRQYGDASFKADSIYTNALGQQYIIEAQSVLVSNIQLSYSDGSTSMVVDTIEAELPLGSDNDVILEDNFGLIQTITPSITPGTIAENGQITQLSFMIGLDDEADLLVPSQVATTHPLGSNNQDVQYVEDVGYTYIRWIIKPQNVTGVDEVTIRLRGADVRRMIDLDISDTMSTAGDDTILTIAVHYDLWLAGIDFAADQSVIESTILGNTENAFSYVP